MRRSFKGGTPASSAVLSSSALVSPAEHQGPPERQSGAGPATFRTAETGGTRGSGVTGVIKGRRQVSRVHTPMLECVPEFARRTHMCAYRGEITTAHRKPGETGRGVLESNIPWEPGSHTHAHGVRKREREQQEGRQVGPVVKGHIRKLYFSDP